MNLIFWALATLLVVWGVVSLVSGAIVGGVLLIIVGCIVYRVSGGLSPPR